MDPRQAGSEVTIRTKSAKDRSQTLLSVEAINFFTHRMTGTGED